MLQYIALECAKQKRYKNAAILEMIDESKKFKQLICTLGFFFCSNHSSKREIYECRNTQWIALNVTSIKFVTQIFQTLISLLLYRFMEYLGIDDSIVFIF